MGLSLHEQFNVAMNAVRTGDMDLASTLLTDPATVTLDEQRTVAQSLGIKRGLLSAFVNTFADPTVWVAMLMSSRFPTSAWLKGTVPTRFVGAANEWSGISLFTRPIENFFRGTHIPKLTSLYQRREAEVHKIGAQIFKITESRPNWRTEKETVAQIMEGMNPANETPELRHVANQMRGHMEELWGFLNQTWKVQGGIQPSQITKATARPFRPQEAPKYLRDYLPHMPLMRHDSTVTIDAKEALKRFGRDKQISEVLRLKNERMESVWSTDEAGRLASDFSRFQGFMNNASGRVFSPRMYRRRRYGLDIGAQTEAGEGIFIADLDVVLQRYIHSVARTYALGAPLSAHEARLASVVDEFGALRPATQEPIIVQVINGGLEATGAEFYTGKIAGTNRTVEIARPERVNAPAMKSLNTLVRTLKGQLGHDEVMFGQLYGTIRNKFQSSMRGILPESKMREIDAAISANELHADYRNKMNGIASYFYGTTLGLNAASSLKNLFQPMLTIAPAIGIGPTLKGYHKLGQRMPVYARNVRQELQALRATGYNPMAKFNLAAERGFYRTFPEFEKLGMKIDPRLWAMDEQAVMEGRFRTLDDFNRVLLAPFTHSELSNQVVSFYGAKEAIRQAIRTGEYPLARGLGPAQLESVMDFEAGLAVGGTQFRPGPGSRSYVQSWLPAPFRQFTSFPTRLWNFFADSTVRGAMTQKQLEAAPLMDKILTLGTGRNLGTLARTYVLGTMANNGLRDALGVDMGEALGLTGPFTSVAPGEQPFAPLPFPPLPSTAWGLISAAGTRDIKRMQPLRLPGIGEIPIPKQLVPGGIAVNRVLRAAQQWRPDIGGFVDDQERMMYRGNTTDFVMAALGVPLDKQRRARDAMDKLYANRGAMRDMRRQYATAKINMDFNEMGRLRQGWAKAFPEMPALQVSDRDLRRYQQTARIPMVTRMLRTLGRNASFLESQLYEYDPDLVAPPQLPLAG